MSTVAAALVLAILLSSGQAKSKPSTESTESTHDILQRLGFDPISRANVNHHRKRVAESKARYNDAYSSDTDSHMYVVKLPPHQPYYAHSKPEKMSNEIITKPPMSFRTNGKPARVYHWNIPILKKMTKIKKYDTKRYGDSKIYHVKVLPEDGGRKHYVEKPLKYHKNNVKMYKLQDETRPANHEHVLSIKELAENGMEVIKQHQHGMETSKHQHAMETSKQHQNDLPMAEAPHDHHQHYKTKLLGRKNTSDRHSNEVSKYSKHDSPIYYSPAIPKQNSFYKYFPGNGKPKSFYVIGKSETPSRYHRLI